MGTIRTCRVAGLVGICMVLVLLVTFQSNRTKFAVPFITKEFITEVPPSLETLRIVSWSPMLRIPGPWFPEGGEAFRKCQLPERATCEYYNNVSLVNTSDAVLFKSTFIHKDRLPPAKGQNQTWVFWERESPSLYPGPNWQELAHMFDIAITYSTATDIAEPYGSCVRKKIVSDGPQRNYAAGKTGQVAWIVSHCNPPSQRQLYARELQKHISVDIYGKCGTKSCLPWLSPLCLEDLLKKKYKFYLAFENSFCMDYITEKFWNSLHYDCLPIVLGGGNYTKYAPAHSYVDVRDFRSPKHLAEYLTLLDGNDTLYNEYFTWKQTYDCGYTDYSQFPCQLCNLLHQRKREHNPDLAKRPKDHIRRIWNSKKQCETVHTFRQKCNCWP